MFSFCEAYVVYLKWNRRKTLFGWLWCLWKGNFLFRGECLYPSDLTKSISWNANNKSLREIRLGTLTFWKFPKKCIAEHYSCRYLINIAIHIPFQLPFDSLLMTLTKNFFRVCIKKLSYEFGILQKKPFDNYTLHIIQAAIYNYNFDLLHINFCSVRQNW